MKNKKAATILIGIIAAFGICITGCGSGSDASGEEGSRQIQEYSKTDSPSEEGEQNDSLKSFEAETLDGNIFTQDDLAQKDVTVINFWSTMCGPCIAEMPDIANFEKALPENVKMLTVCLDGSENAEIIRQFLAEAGYEGTTLLSGTGDLKKMCEKIQYIPTTIVADRDGTIIGEPLIGGQENLEEVYTEMVNDALKAMGKEEMADGEK